MSDDDYDYDDSEYDYEEENESEEYEDYTPIEDEDSNLADEDDYWFKESLIFLKLIRSRLETYFFKETLFWVSPSTLSLF